MAGSPFFDKTSTYGSSGGARWNETPFVRDNLDYQIPSGVYMSYLAQSGLGGLDRLSQFAQGLYGKTQSGYQAALRVNPSLSYLKYLNTQFGGHARGINDIWAGLSPDEKGERPNLWVQPARLIGWG